MRWLSSVVALAIAGVVSAVVGPGAVTGDTRVHDPTICKDAKGKYFIFSTGKGIEIRTSMDRKAWTFEGYVWPGGANWTNEYTSNGILWAPDCTIIEDQFYLYYSASSPGSQKSAIFLAKSYNGLPGSFQHHGLVMSTKKGDDHNAIDPALFKIDKTWYLASGSYWTGIKGVTVSPSTGKPNIGSFDSLAQRTGGTTAIEAPVIFKYGDYYYLFTSWDRCCNAVHSTYNIRVGRSKHLTSGYVDANEVALTSGGGTLVLRSHDNIHGPGHCDVMQDNDGPILVYHYYTTDGSFLGINRLDFSSGWPVVV